MSVGWATHFGRTRKISVAEQDAELSNRLINYKHIMQIEEGVQPGVLIDQVHDEKCRFCKDSHPHTSIEGLLSFPMNNFKFNIYIASRVPGFVAAASAHFD